METFQFYFELIGAAAFAISGAALGIRKEMDLFGVAMLGMTTAVGGGMLRDTMLGLTPPTALRDPVQALVAIAVSILVFFVWRRRKAELHNRYAETVLLLADSLGLASSPPTAPPSLSRRGTGLTGSWCCSWGCSPAWAAACCGMCAARSGPISSPSTCTPARRWPARRCVCCCGLWVRERP